VLDRQRTRREAAHAVRVEDVIPAEMLDDVGDADRDYLEQVFRDPQRFLPPRPEPAREPDRADEDGEPESRFARRAKLAGLVAAGALVAGAVVAAPMLTSSHRAVSAGGQSTPAGFSGAAELGGLAVPQHQAGGGAPAQHGTSTPGTHSAGGTPATPDPAGGSTPPKALPSTANPIPDQAADARSAARKIQAVKEFYAAIARNPSGALAQLSPSLAGGAAGELVRTWSSMDAIDVQEGDTQIKPDGSILAVATLRRPDGGLVRVTQLFRVADTGGLITEAELVSAQYM
jgi:hypothetical protein